MAAFATGVNIAPSFAVINPLGVNIQPQGLNIQPVLVYIFPVGVNVQPQVRLILPLSSPETFQIIMPMLLSEETHTRLTQMGNSVYLPQRPYAAV